MQYCVIAGGRIRCVQCAAKSKLSGEPCRAAAMLGRKRANSMAEIQRGQELQQAGPPVPKRKRSAARKRAI